MKAAMLELELDSFESDFSSVSRSFTWIDFVGLFFCVGFFAIPWVNSYYIFCAVSSLRSTHQDNISEGDISEGHWIILGVFANIGVLSVELVTVPAQNLPFVYAVIAETALFVVFLFTWMRTPQIHMAFVLIAALAMTFKLEMAVRIVKKKWGARRRGGTPYDNVILTERSRLLIA